MANKEKKDEVPKKQTEEEIIASYKMVKGDYRLKVRVYEANDLIPANAHGLEKINIFSKKAGAADPLVKIEVGKLKKYTKAKKRTLSPLFNEVFFFNLKDMKKEDLEGTTIKFTVMDKNSWVSKDSIIGSYELDLTSVYFALNHELFQIWLTLTDPTDEREGIMGYLKVTLECLGPNDEPNVHDVTTDKDPNKTKEKNFFSNKIKQEGYCLSMHVFRAEALAPMDMLSPEVDGYVMCKYSGIKNKSRVVTSKNPEWNEKVNVGCMLPNQSKFITCEVWDYDLVGSDDLIGTFKVKFQDIREKELQVRWANLYGAPLTAKDEKQAELMTLYGETMGSTYRGRVLYGFTSGYVGEPKTETKPLKFHFPEDPIPQSSQRTYLLRVDIWEGNELPERKQAIIHVAIGPYIVKTKPITISNGRASWFESLEDKRVVFPCNKDEIPDIIIYYADANEEDRRHAFSRIKASEVLIDSLDQKPFKPRVIKFKEDRSLDLITDDEFPGFLFASINLYAINPPERLPLTNNIKMEDFQLRVHLFIGRSLPPADQEGVSDPFVIIRCGGQTVRSTIKQSTLNPGWYETMKLNVTLPAFEEGHIPSGMMLAVYDADDDEGNKRDLLGRTWITFKDNFVKFKINSGKYENEVIDMVYQKPKWWNMIYDGTDEVQGTLLVGYALIKSADAHKIPEEKLYPEGKPEKLYIFCVGLRDIEEDSQKIKQMKLKSLSASFDISGDDHEPVCTPPEKILNGGVNMNNFQTVIIDVPKNKHLCPVLDTYVWDHSLNPSNAEKKTMLGNCTIELSKLLTKYYLSAVDRERIEKEEEEEGDIADRLNKEVEEDIMGGFKYEGILYEEVQDEEIFKFIASELPKTRKIVKDEEYKSEIMKEEEHKSMLLQKSLLHKSKKAQLSKINKENQHLSLDYSPIKEDEEDQNYKISHINLKPLGNFNIPNTKILQEEPYFNPPNEKSETQLQKEKPFFKVPEEPTKFISAPAIESKKSIPSQKIMKITDKIESKKEFEEESLLDNSNPEKNLMKIEENHYNFFDSHENETIKKVNVNKFPDDDESETSSKNHLLNDIPKEGLRENLPKTPNIEIPQPNSIINNSKVLVEPIIENKEIKEPVKTIPPPPATGQAYLETLKVTSQMSISQASKASSGALSARDLPPDNLQFDVQKKIKPKENIGGFGKLKLFGKSLSRKLMNQIKKNEEHYEDYDSDDNEDLDLTPEWMKGRERYKDDLEDIIKMDKYIRRFPIMSGQTRGKTNIFNTDKGEARQQVCLLKCIFLEGNTTTKEQEVKMKQKIDKLQKLMRPQEFIARLYVLTGRDIQPVGEGKPNSYLKVIMGKRVIDDKDSSLRKDTYLPEYYRCYESHCYIPGSAFLRIEVWNSSDGLGDDDDMIGFTEIDLEDRYFTGQWRKYQKKPIEMRNLKSEVMQGSMGRLELWVELIPKKMQTKFPKENICAPPKYKFELRTIIWGTQDCVFKDELEKCNDLYVRGSPANMEAMETDVHWRCRAKGSFNWRWKFTVFYPLRTEDDYGSDRFKISLWDKDIITSDEMIGETDIDLNIHNMISKACKRLKPVKMTRRVLERSGEITDRLWFDVFHPQALDSEGKPQSQGKVQVSFELLPEKEFEKKVNGFGRDSPNIYPVLPEPVGRFKFDFLNPLGMCKELLGPSLYGKMWKALCSVICCILLVYLVYIILTQGAAVAIFG